MRLSLLLAITSVNLSSLAAAQAIKPEPPTEKFSAEVVAAIEMPELAFEENPQSKKDYKKYFYFHRPDTNFERAFADIKECDALASGISYYNYADPGAAMAQYGLLAGAIGGAIGNLMADAIFGSAERRKTRRANLRRCMGFKGYNRYGLDRELWQAFNFEEGNSKVPLDERRDFLLKQAKVASGPAPDQEVLVK